MKKIIENYTWKICEDPKHTYDCLFIMFNDVFNQ